LVYPVEEFSRNAEGSEAVDGLNLRELMVESGSRCEGKHVRHIAWPADFVIARLNRGNQGFVPGADTVLQVGDTLVIMSTEEAFRQARMLCQSGDTPL
jgi:Trk K+ transport system NAD-binding subunit